MNEAHVYIWSCLQKLLLPPTLFWSDFLKCILNQWSGLSFLFFFFFHQCFLFSGMSFVQIWLVVEYSVIVSSRPMVCSRRRVGLLTYDGVDRDSWFTDSDSGYSCCYIKDKNRRQSLSLGGFWLLTQFIYYFLKCNISKRFHIIGTCWKEIWNEKW